MKKQALNPYLPIGKEKIDLLEFSFEERAQ